MRGAEPRKYEGGQPSLPAKGFERLLQRLAPNRDDAGAEFERLRRTLTRFFDWRGAVDPDACADTTLDRVARKLDEGVDVRDLPAFARGVARLVFHEAGRARRLEPLERADAVESSSPDPGSEPSQERVLSQCVDSCLSELEPQGRELVLAYYAEEGRRKIEGRERLARGLGLTANALRSRVQRLRDRLEACITRCATRMGGGPHHE